jgi:hypothetical protein
MYTIIIHVTVMLLRRSESITDTDLAQQSRMIHITTFAWKAVGETSDEDALKARSGPLNG